MCKKYQKKIVSKKNSIGFNFSITYKKIDLKNIRNGKCFDIDT